MYTYNEYVVLGALQAVADGEHLDRLIDSLRFSANRARIISGEGGPGRVPVKAPPFCLAPPFRVSRYPCPRNEMGQRLHSPGRDRGQIISPQIEDGQRPPMPTRVPAIAKEGMGLQSSNPDTVRTVSMVTTKAVTMGLFSVVTTKAYSTVISSTGGVPVDRQQRTHIIEVVSRAWSVPRHRQMERNNRFSHRPF